MSETDRVLDIIPTEWIVDQEEDGKGGYKLVEWVVWQKKGNPNSAIRDKVERIRKQQAEVWAALEPYYTAWKKNEEEPVNGTPLFLWPAMTKKMVDVYKMNGLRSIEDVSNMTDADCSRLGMGASLLRDQAKRYVANKRGTKDLESILSERDEKIKKLEDQITELLEKASEPKTPKRRGRPPKEAA